jgi:hypothetical protein
MVIRRIPLLCPLVLSCALVGCGGSPEGQSPNPSPAPESTQAAPAASASTVVPDPLDPCTWLTTDEINRTLAASLGDRTGRNDEARQIVTCNWTQPSPFGIVNIGLSLTPGADAYQTNLDLAPAYFDGEANPITVAGAEKSYLVIKKDQNASVIGMLVNGRFVLIQVAIDSATAEQAQSLAAQVASRMK